MAAVADYFLSQFDTSPAIQATLLGTDGKTAVNLTGATVRLSVKPANGAAVLTGGLASIVGDPTLGVVRYQWQPVDVALAGMFNAEWIVTFPGAHEMTWPNDKYLRIEIKARLDPGDTPPVPSPLVGTIAVIVSLDGISTGTNRLNNLSTTSLASGSLAWCELEQKYFILDKTGSKTVDGVSVIAGLNGGQWSVWTGGGGSVVIEAVLISNQSMNSTFTTVGLDVSTVRNLGLGFYWTGTVIGVFKLQWSNDSTDGTNGTWDDVTDVTFPAQPAGAGSKFGMSLPYNFRWIRVVWTQSSSTGTCTKIDLTGKS